jgi:hypothetical protein
MARAPIGRHPCVTGIRDRANDNETPVRHTNDASQELPRELVEAGHVTDDDMVIVHNPASGDWMIADYAGEAVLFQMPRDCSLAEVRRAAALYAAAFKYGYEQGKFVARSTSILHRRTPRPSPTLPRLV